MGYSAARCVHASIFAWAALPSGYEGVGSLEFSKQLMSQASVAVSPGVGFGGYGEGYVRIALVENEQRIRQSGAQCQAIFKNTMMRRLLPSRLKPK